VRVRRYTLLGTWVLTNRASRYIRAKYETLRGWYFSGMNYVNSVEVILVSLVLSLVITGEGP